MCVKAGNKLYIDATETLCYIKRVIAASILPGKGTENGADINSTKATMRDSTYSSPCREWPAGVRLQEENMEPVFEL